MTTSERCLGRIVRNTVKGGFLLPFEDEGGNFHIPIRCNRKTRKELNGLCERCYEKDMRTYEKLQILNGRATLPGAQSSYLHGCVTDPVPFWSRLYDGAWYRLKLESGCRVSEDTMGKVKKAVAAAYAGVEVAAEPEPLPVAAVAKKGGAAKTMRKKKVEEAPVVVAPAVEAPAPALEKKRKAPVKKGGEPAPVEAPPQEKGAAALEPPVAIIRQQFPEPIEDVLTIRVVPKEIGGRKVYLEPKKQKVYDLKFHYIGRYNSKEAAITTFPDSDAE